MSTYLKKLEDYPELEASIIRGTKIHKVLKAMIKLQSIPRDAEYGFKKRSVELLAKWTQVLNESAGDDKGGDKADDDKEPEKKEAPVTNGDAAEDKSTEAAKPEEPVTKTKEKSEEKTEATEPKADAETAAIGTKVEGEKEAEAEADKPAEPSTEVKTDEPDVAKAPAEAYNPPAETAEPTVA